MRYEYRCLEHPQQMLVIFRSAAEQHSWTEGICPVCGEKLELNLQGNGGFKFAFTYGKETGVHDLDYGKHGTWDLTPPGKMERMKRLGIVKDPFDSGPAPVTNDDLVGAI
jgi:hypothetical protein